MSSFATLPAGDRYWLLNARVPLVFLDSRREWSPLPHLSHPPVAEDLVAVDIEISSGQITCLQPAGQPLPPEAVGLDIQKGLIWPCFVDAHTHLDKGHIWERMPNPDGTFDSALAVVAKDREKRWDAEDLYRRMNFGLKCSYAHGTQAIRTHLDAFGDQAATSVEVFQVLRREWEGRIALEGVCLVSLDYYQTAQGEQLADLMAEAGGILGGVTQMGPDLDDQLDRLFSLAQERNLALDLHTDESLDPNDITLRHVAMAKQRHGFSAQVTCAHCCSLSVQAPAVANATMDWVKETEIAIISLPMCNLYLQDRQPQRMPRYRGVTLLHELKQRGILVILASDNCRDPFFAYGDHDALEVFTQSARIGHLDRPFADWPLAVTRLPGELMGLPDSGRIATGSSADLIVFKARTFNELLARPQSDRIVIRKGQAIDTTLPDYAELDDLMAELE
ncbi:cytosine deaminase [Sphaerothrix gracilis]|uniref:cytosine deaminase n=1 Tax=Sphaerothrix gracilis TaxID=3151835 RepID=UPI0031FC80B5